MDQIKLLFFKRNVGESQRIVKLCPLKALNSGFQVTFTQRWQWLIHDGTFETLSLTSRFTRGLFVTISM